MALTVRESLEGAGARLAASSRNARRDAELLLTHVLRVSYAALLTHPERALSAAEAAAYETAVARRLASEPIQYITGVQEFFGLPLKVTPAVLIPRPETELLVEEALALARRPPLSSTQPLRILDVGTGSGAIAVALGVQLPGASITALDLSAAALEVARENARTHQVSARIRFLQSDLLSAVEGEHFDLIAANLPYVSDTDTLEAEVARYEPRQALFAGPTGLEMYQRLIPEASPALPPGGWLLLELGWGQREVMERLLSGWQSLRFIPDLQGIPRVAAARKAGPEKSLRAGEAEGSA